MSGISGGGAGAFALAPDRARDGATRRYLAVQHTLIAETAEADLVKVWESTLSQCRQPRCEVINSSLNKEGSESSLSASLSLRIVPEDFPTLFGRLSKAAEIVQHVTASEDKTDTVIDVEAQLKNLTEYRDRLRSLLDRSSASLKDVIEIQKELVRVQTELDAAQGKRKVLANETDKVAVEIAFRVRGSVATGMFGPVANALRSAGRVFSESLAAVITLVIASIPWVLVGVPVLWLIRNFWRRRRAAKPITTP